MLIYLRNNGYNVKIFNLVNHELSDSWNCLGEIGGSEIMAQTFVDVIIKNTGSPKGDPFWDNATLNLLKALTLFVVHEHPPETRNIGEVYSMITKYNQSELNKIFDMIPISHPAKAPFEIFKQSSESVRGGVIVGLGSRLQVFQNRLIKEITSHNDIDLELMGRKKCAYFCITSDQDSTFDFLSSLMMSFLFIKIVRYADTKGVNGALPIHVHILADELANIVATQIAV